MTEAVCYLGLDTIKSLVLSIHVFSQFEREKLETLPLDGLWDHSLLTAGGAKLISKLENCPQKIVDESFSSGMLHDAGKLILAFNFPKEYGQALAESQTQPISSLEIERRAFGATHAEIGGYLLGLWGLPVPVVEAIALHHDPALSTIKTFSPLTAVHAADALTTPKIKARAEHAALDLKYLSEIGLADRVKIWQDALSPLTPEQTT